MRVEEKRPDQLREIATATIGTKDKERQAKLGALHSHKVFGNPSPNTKRNESVRGKGCANEVAFNARRCTTIGARHAGG